ncbi:MAG: hypothetical protein ACLVAU_13285 [Ruminococcus sp.]
MFDKKDVRVIDSKDDNQDDMSIVIEEQTDGTSERITTTEAKKDIKSDLKNDKKRISAVKVHQPQIVYQRASLTKEN